MGFVAKYFSKLTCFPSADASLSAVMKKADAPTDLHDLVDREDGEAADGERARGLVADRDANI